MKYFNHCKTLSDLRNTYYKLLRINHPDNGGNVETCQEINAEYDLMFEKLKDTQTAESKDNYDTNINDDLTFIINQIIKLNDLIIEIKGCWIWVSGNTYPVKEILKARGFKFCKKDNKPYWIWHPVESQTLYFGKSRMSVAAINRKYGNDTIYTSKAVCLA